MLGLAQRSQDELFHIALYNWLIQADLTDKLLEVRVWVAVSYGVSTALLNWHQAMGYWLISAV